MNQHSQFDQYGYGYSSSSEPSRAGWMLSGAVLAMVAMYFGDPDRGAQRRTEAQDKLRDAADRSRTMLDSTSRDLGTRMQGMREQCNSLMSKTTETFSSQMDNGRKLREMAMQEEWPQNLRTAAMLAGAAASTLGAMRRSPAGSIAALAGLVLLARGISNTPLSNMASTFRPTSRATPIRLNKSIFIDAAPERVYDIWSNYENFPRFMSNLREVRDLGGGRSHWVASGPAGFPISWEATTTESNRPHTLGWRSEPGAMVENHGTIRFEPVGTGTRVTVEFSYTPPGGEIGHKIASMFQKDPKQQMDEDLENMRKFIESGATQQDTGGRSNDQPGSSVLH